MKIEILYFDGCPTYRTAEGTVRGVLAEQDIEATVELVAVNTDDAGSMLSEAGAVPAIVHDDAGNISPGAGSADFVDDAGNVRHY